MAYRPDDEHDKILSLQKQINTLRTSGAIFRNNGVGINTSQAGINSSVASTSIIGSWAFPPVNHNVGSATGTGGAFVNNVADGSGRYHIQIKSTAINVVGTPNPLVLSYIDGTQRNGQFVLIRCAQGQSLTLKAATALDNTQGNINMSADLSLSSTQMAILQFWNDVGTAGGQYILVSTTGTGGASSGANTFLSNLTAPTAINQDLLPSSDNIRALGTSSLNYKDIFTYILNIHSNVTDPSTNGEFRTNGNDCKVFSGGVVRNFTNMVQDISSYRLTGSAGSSWYTTPITQGAVAQSSSLQLLCNTIYLIPFVVGKFTKLNGIGVFVNTVGGFSELNFGIYSDSGNMVPHSLLFSTGSLSFSAGGVVNVFGSTIATLNPGQVVWLAIAVEFPFSNPSSIDVIGLNSNYIIPLLGTTSGSLGNTPNYVGYTSPYTSGSGNLPATISSASATNANMPALYVQVFQQS